MTAIQSYRNHAIETESEEVAEEYFFCICCDQQVSSLDPCCGNCYAPTEVSRSIANREVQPDFISILGASNAGKTVSSRLPASHAEHSTYGLWRMASLAY